ncbi:hypothetical protein MKX03_025464 [Papaver bracteatum]|nr:hypothetical protein MKX03_025464 [Papaver bracteatum]
MMTRKQANRSEYPMIKSVREKTIVCRRATHVHSTCFVNAAIEGFEAKDYGTANKFMTLAMGAGTGCEKTFKKSGVRSSMTKINGDFVQLTKISLAIIRMVKR